MKTERRDLHKLVTDRIVAALEAGVKPWHKPWKAGNAAGRIIRPLRHNGTPYQGINVLILWGAAADGGFTSPYWMTFQQALAMGAHVRKGSKGEIVVYASTFTRAGTDEGGDDTEEKIPFLKAYVVFNAEQIEGLPASYFPQPVSEAVPTVTRIAEAEGFFAAIPADVRHGGNRAFFSPTYDFVQLPPFEAFENPEAYYSTRAHEMGHWTGHKNRLERAFGARFGDNTYAFEELVAELSAAFVCAELGIMPEDRDDHAAYIASWLKVLKQDKRAIFTAASAATKAADLLASYQQQVLRDAAE